MCVCVLCMCVKFCITSGKRRQQRPEFLSINDGEADSFVCVCCCCCWSSSVRPVIYDDNDSKTTAAAANRLC